jgi:hypothetical protein
VRANTDSAKHDQPPFPKRRRDDATTRLLKQQSPLVTQYQQISTFEVIDSFFKCYKCYIYSILYIQLESYNAGDVQCTLNYIWRYTLIMVQYLRQSNGIHSNQSILSQSIFKIPNEISHHTLHSFFSSSSSQ